MPNKKRKKSFIAYTHNKEWEEDFVDTGTIIIPDTTTYNSKFSKLKHYKELLGIKLKITIEEI